mgnify:CR=1 FL=1
MKYFIIKNYKDQTKKPLTYPGTLRQAKNSLRRMKSIGINNIFIAKKEGKKVVKWKGVEEGGI